MLVANASHGNGHLQQIPAKPPSPQSHIWVLLQACGDWDEALKVADKSDRINLKATHFRFAQHHEAMGDFAAATKHYQLSDTHR